MLRNINLHPHPHSSTSTSGGSSTSASAAAAAAAANALLASSANMTANSTASAANGGFSIYSRNISYDQDYRNNYTFHNASAITSAAASAASASVGYAPAVPECNSLMPSPQRSPVRFNTESLFAGLERKGFYIVKSSSQLPKTAAAAPASGQAMPMPSAAPTAPRNVMLKTITINVNNNNNSAAMANNNHLHHLHQAHHQHTRDCVARKGVVESLHNYSKQQCEEETDRLRRKALERGYDDEEDDDDDEEEDEEEEDDEEEEVYDEYDGAEKVLDEPIDVVADEQDEVEMNVTTAEVEDDDDDESAELVIDESPPVIAAPIQSTAVATNAQRTPEKSPANGLQPEHHARRPMNAFLIFCKRHRGIVREKYPNLENRAITKILGDWWANMDAEEKECFNRLAREYKDAFFDANPTFQWYKLPAPPLRTLVAQPTTSSQSTTNVVKNVAPPHVGMFKLADEAQMGGLNNLMGQQDRFAASLSLKRTTTKEVDRKTSDLQAALGDVTTFFAKAMSTNRTEPFRHYRSMKRKSDPEALRAASPPPAKRSVSESSIVTTPAEFEQFMQANLKLEPDFGAESSDTGAISHAADNPTAFAAEAPDSLPTKSARACKGKRYLEFINTVRVTTAAPKRLPKSAVAVHTTTAHNGASSSSSPTTPQQQPHQHEMFDHPYASMMSSGASNLEPRSCSSGTAGGKAKAPVGNNDTALEFDLNGKITALHALSLDEYLSRKRDTKKSKKKITAKKTTPSVASPMTTAAKQPSNKRHQSKSKLAAQKRAAASEALVAAQRAAATFVEPRQQDVGGPFDALMDAQTVQQRREQLRREQAVGSQKRKARKESITRRDVLAMRGQMPAPATTVTVQHYVPVQHVQQHVQQPYVPQHVPQLPAASVSPEPQVASPDLFILAQVAAIITSK